MSRLRQLSPWYWVTLGAILVAAGILLSNLFLDWAPKWLTLAALIVPLAVSIFVFRMLWKQTDHPAFHGESASSERLPPGDGDGSNAALNPHQGDR